MKSSPLLLTVWIATSTLLLLLAVSGCTSTETTVPIQSARQTPSNPKMPTQGESRADATASGSSSTTGVNARNKSGTTKLMMAAWTGNTDEAKALIAAGADVNSQETQGQSPLLLAAFKGNLEIVNILIAAGAQINTTNQDGDTALTLAARNGHTSSIKALIAAGANINAQEDTFGQAALTLAAKNGRTDAVKALIAAGADVKAQDNDAKTAVDYAKKYPDIVAALKAAEAQAPKSAHARLNGTSLEAELTKQGIDGKSHIDVFGGDLSQAYTSIRGAKLKLSTRHQWAGPITLRGFDSGGKAAYSIGAMVAQQDQAGNVVTAVLPMGPGTIYRIFGKVQLLGNTINADGDTPLVLVVHNARNTDDAKADFMTNGPLSPTVFYVLDDLDLRNPAAKKEEVLLQLVHVDGRGSAKLKDGTSITFK